MDEPDEAPDLLPDEVLALQRAGALLVDVREADEWDAGRIPGSFHLPLSELSDRWQELPDAKACRIAAWYPGASIGDESRWDEYLAWLTQRLVKMDRVLRPVVKGLP